MTPADLSSTVLHAVRRAVDEDALRAPVPARVRVERTRPGGSGDYACAVALQLAGPAGLPPRGVAEILRERVVGAPGIGRVEITGPGFLNFTLDASADAASRAARVREVAGRGLRYGWVTTGAGALRRLHHPREIRSAVVAQSVGHLLRTQGDQVLIGCAREPGPGWDRLGLHVAPGAGTVERTEERAVPVGAEESAEICPVPVGAEKSAEIRPVPVGAEESAEIRPVPAGATADALLERLGADATRWGLLRPAGHDRAPLGGDLLVQTEANPLFLVRYAHARTRALLREGERLGLTAAYDADVDAPALHAALADHPGVLAAAARHHAPDRLARHLETVARAFFDLHDACPPLPVGDEKPSAAHRSRLALAEAAGTVLAGGLSLLGISAPEHL
ncbi:ArgS-related anticodon-binding protein NrtL [Streptomyces griseus]|uniref:ArgS-related anticodon-binding protein NrtL n=1 Tax=Streptomyces griseus TaxID=1911 RepID=UPI0008402275|nr:DALR anticodon-binding domain-containing protein [Streptomyces griseus]